VITELFKLHGLDLSKPMTIDYDGGSESRSWRFREDPDGQIITLEKLRRMVYSY
jgi:hypothetical protein